MRASIIREKTYAFAVSIVRLCRKMQSQQKEYVITKQLIRSGTAPGALIREAEQAESRKDFIHKMSIALKEIHETDYWLNIMRDTGYIVPDEFERYHVKCIEIIKILTAIIKSSKAK